jgi:hypothetical protein
MVTYNEKEGEHHPLFFVSILLVAKNEKDITLCCLNTIAIVCITKT